MGKLPQTGLPQALHAALEAAHSFKPFCAGHQASELPCPLLMIDSIIPPIPHVAPIPGLPIQREFAPVATSFAASRAYFGNELFFPAVTRLSQRLASHVGVDFGSAFVQLQALKLESCHEGDAETSQHVYTPSCEAFGSLHIHLPAVVIGGETTFVYEGDTVLFENGCNGEPQHVASYTFALYPAERRTQPLKAGCRLTLEFELFWDSHGPIQPSAGIPRNLSAVAEELRIHMNTSPQQAWVIFLQLGQKYEESHFENHGCGLRGTDEKVVSSLLHAAQMAGCYSPKALIVSLSSSRAAPESEARYSMENFKSCTESRCAGVDFIMDLRGSNANTPGHKYHELIGWPDFPDVNVKSVTCTPGRYVNDGSGTLFALKDSGAPSKDRKRRSVQLALLYNEENSCEILFGGGTEVKDIFPDTTQNVYTGVQKLLKYQEARGVSHKHAWVQARRLWQYCISRKISYGCVESIKFASLFLDPRGVEELVLTTLTEWGWDKIGYEVHDFLSRKSSLTSVAHRVRTAQKAKDLIPSHTHHAVAMLALDAIKQQGCLIKCSCIDRQGGRDGRCSGECKVRKDTWLLFFDHLLWLVGEFRFSPLLGIHSLAGELAGKVKRSFETVAPTEMEIVREAVQQVMALWPGSADVVGSLMQPNHPTSEQLPMDQNV